MSRTQLTGNQLGDSTVRRHDLDAVTTGQAVIRKVVAGTNVSLASTGIDAGTGDVTISTLGLSTYIQDTQPAGTNYFWIQTNYLVTGGVTMWIAIG